MKVYGIPWSMSASQLGMACVSITSLILCSICGAASVSEAQEFAYKVSGRIWYESVSGGTPTIRPEYTKEFTITVSTDTYSFYKADDKRHIHASSDGVDSYYLVDLANANNANGNITAGTYPFDSPWYVRIAWLVYASGSYISEKPEISLVAPWNIPRRDLVPNAFHADVSFSSGSPKLPEIISFLVKEPISERIFDNMMLLTVADEMRAREEEFERLQAEFAPGFVGGEYEVEGWTNWAGLMLPLKATLLRYDPQLGLTEIYHCKTISLEAAEPPVTPAPLTRATSVKDYRYRDPRKGINFVSLFVTNNVWPKFEQKLDRAILARAAQQDIFLRPPGTSQYQWVIWVIVGAVLLAPAIYFMIKRHHQNS